MHSFVVQESTRDRRRRSGWSPCAGRRKTRRPLGKSVQEGPETGSGMEDSAGDDAPNNRKEGRLCQRLLGDAMLYVLLQRLDADLAEQARAAGCAACGEGALHSASYPRKPRGVANALLPEGYATRYSFCCADEGCRRRTTPPSLRFLGRRVYLGAVVVLATAMQHGVTAWRAARLRELTGASLRTLVRWRRWWTEAFAAGPVWTQVRARLQQPVKEATLPLSLLSVFDGAERERLVALLRLLLPLTTPGVARHAG